MSDLREHADTEARELEDREEDEKRWVAPTPAQTPKALNEADGAGDSDDEGHCDFDRGEATRFSRDGCGRGGAYDAHAGGNGEGAVGTGAGVVEEAVSAS